MSVRLAAEFFGGAVRTTVRGDGHLLRSRIASRRFRRPVFLPSSAAECSALRVRVPDWLFLLNEATGNLVPVIGDTGAALAPFATPLYRQRLPGWLRPFLGTVKGTASHRFSTTSTLLNLAGGESYAQVAVGSLDGDATGQRVMTAQGNNNRIRVSDAGDTLLGSHAGVNVATTRDYRGIGAVHGIVWFRDAAADVSGIATELEVVIGTHAEAALAGQEHTLGAANTVNAAETRFCWLGIYKGTNAEGIVWPTFFARLGLV